MTFVPPLAEQRFVLDHVADLPALTTHAAFSAVDADMTDAILHGAGALAAGEWAPLNRVGDMVGAQWAGGAVTMPPGFREAYGAYVDGGWGTLVAPEAFGGQALPHALGMAVAESLGAANLSLSLCPMLTAGAIEALLHHGSLEQQAVYLPKLVSGEWTGTMNLTEPQAGSDVGALRTAATPAGDGGWRIKGTKIFITFGEHDLADNIIHLVLARTPGAPAGTKGISLFLVPKFLADGSRNDLRCSSIEHKLGIHASPTCVMSFGDNDKCQGWLIGAEGAGMRAMFTMMNNARINVGLQGVSVAERATQAAFAYARERVQSPRAGSGSSMPVAIIEHPDVRRMLMRMQAQTQAIRALLYASAAEVDRARLGTAGAQTRLDILTPLAKSHGTDVGCEVASLGVQIHGGMGFIEETGAAQYYRDIRIAPIYEGTNGIQAADLVSRKLTADKAVALKALIGDVLAEAQTPGLIGLANDISVSADWLLEARTDDRLAASSPFLTMTSVMVCGWLMERQNRAAQVAAIREANPFLRSKLATTNWYLAHIVSEAMGLSAQVRQGARYLYDLN